MMKQKEDICWNGIFLFIYKNVEQGRGVLYWVLMKKKAIMKFRIQKDFDNLYDATEEEVAFCIDKTLQFLQDMEKLIAFKGE